MDLVKHLPCQLCGRALIESRLGSDFTSLWEKAIDLHRVVLDGKGEAMFACFKD